MPLLYFIHTPLTRWPPALHVQYLTMTTLPPTNLLTQQLILTRRPSVLHVQYLAVTDVPPARVVLYPVRAEEHGHLGAFHQSLVIVCSLNGPDHCLTHAT